MAVAIGLALKLAVTAQIRAGLARFAVQARDAGWTVIANLQGQSQPSWQWRDLTGPPWAAAVTLRSVAVERTDGGPRIRWTAERLVVGVTAFDPAFLAITATGEQTVALGTAQPRAFNASGATLRLALNDAGPAWLTIDALETTGARLEYLSGRIAPLSIDVAAQMTPRLAGLPPAFDRPATLSARLRATRELPGDEGAAQAWRSARGQVTAEAISLDWGPLHAAGHGSLSLDEQLQPEVQASMSVLGAGEALDAAARTGLIGTGPANAARAVAGVLAMANPSGAATLPLTLNRQTLSIAQFPLARVPRLEWNLP